MYRASTPLIGPASVSMALYSTACGTFSSVQNRLRSSSLCHGTQSFSEDLRKTCCAAGRSLPIMEKLCAVGMGEHSAGR